MEQYQEGCLSVPGFYENVDRPQKVKVKALDRDGKPYELIAEGLLAVCIQHECDHLNGKLFVDYLSNLMPKAKTTAATTPEVKGSNGAVINNLDKLKAKALETCYPFSDCDHQILHPKSSDRNKVTE